MKKKFLCLLLALTMIAILVACEMARAASVDLMIGVEPNVMSIDKTIVEENAIDVTDFGIRLFQAGSEEDKNTAISPLSVIYMLAMTANGAKGETLAQMEAVIGSSIGELNEFLFSYMTQLPSTEKNSLSLANAIWLKKTQSFSANQDFLQTNADYYGAGVFLAPFDAETCEDINRWVCEQSNGMIKDMISEMSTDAVMYLISAIAFDAEWKTTYTEAQVRPGIFMTEAGDERTVNFMYQSQDLFLEDDYATGFVKHYANEEYAFVAMVPSKGISLSEYIDSLSGEHIRNLLLGSEMIGVRTAIPKFSCEFSVELKDILRTMGMTTVFDSGDLSGIGSAAEGPLYISSVLHKTYIAVDENGTKAGAATVTQANPSSGPTPIEYKTVYLDRPFFYMIIDCTANIPIFIGAVYDVVAG